MAENEGSCFPSSFLPLPSRLSFSDYVCMIKCLGRRSRYFGFTQTNAALNNERWPACIFQIFVEAKLFLPHGSLTLFELTRCLHSQEEKLLPWLNTFSYKNYRYIVTKKKEKSSKQYVRTERNWSCFIFVAQAWVKHSSHKKGCSSLLNPCFSSFPKEGREEGGDNCFLITVTQSKP